MIKMLRNRKSTGYVNGDKAEIELRNSATHGLYEIRLKRFEYIEALGIKFEKTLRRVVLKYSNEEKAKKEWEKLKKKYEIEV